MDNLHTYAAAIVRATAPDLFVEQSDENSYEYAEDLVRLNLRDDEDYGFMRHLREVHGYDNAEISPMLWTILHEIGHAETCDDYSDREYEKGLKVKMNLACLPLEQVHTDPQLQDLYFNTAEEWYATEWAIDFVKKHLKKCKRWSEKLEALK